MDARSFGMVFITVSSSEEAERLAAALVEERLAACVTQVPGVISTYRWEGRVTRDAEVLLLCKTRTDRFADLEARVRQLHSSQVPEIVLLPILDGSAPYLRWLDDSLTSPAP
jgi:periplasmic divalent cation tolerance protein